MGLGLRIQPFDAAVAVETNHAIGKRVKSALEAFQHLRQRALLALARAHAAVEPGKDYFPGTAALRQGLFVRSVEPGQQPVEVNQIPDQDAEQGDDRCGQPPGDTEDQREWRERQQRNGHQGAGEANPRTVQEFSSASGAQSMAAEKR